MSRVPHVEPSLPKVAAYRRRIVMGVAAAGVVGGAGVAVRWLSPGTYLHWRGYAEGRHALSGPHDIIVIGDSIAAAGPWQKAFPHRRVGNFGRNGETTLELLRRLPEIEATPAREVFVLTGINDVRIGERTADIIADTIAQIAGKLASGGRKVVVNTLFPPHPGLTQTHWGINIDLQRVGQVNALLPALVKARGAIMADLLPVLASGGHLMPDHTSDGVHLNAAAYEAVVKAWKALGCCT